MKIFDKDNTCYILELLSIFREKKQNFISSFLQEKKNQINTWTNLNLWCHDELYKEQIQIWFSNNKFVRIKWQV